MANMRGRRMAERSRFRSGNLMHDGETLDPAVAPVDPGTGGDGGTGGGVGIVIDIGFLF